ncbi:MAG: hypothetical protein JRG92_10930, partial [Deltaproteobacteria bacterium]|nr:hypothetical protein [Deltaproteobacteria bacterium]
KDLSSTTSYLLYTTGKNPFLIANAVCGGYQVPTAGDGCSLFGEGTTGFIPNQVGVAHNSSSSTLAGVPAPAPPGTELVILTFEVISTAAGAELFDFDFDLARGGILQLGDGSRVALGLGASEEVFLPEPTVGLLSLAALATVVTIQRRRHA